MADLKAELEAESKNFTRDEGRLDLQHFLAEIKDEDKEDILQRKLMKVLWIEPAT